MLACLVSRSSAWCVSTGTCGRRTRASTWAA
ncbi:hypothetical protein E2C01_085138 [Portunus trituberculatus]|uniref:Uncharacterized protein n=1 Tax=Portunus trituberculatus TaxID=210409 RepID=A0A5B7J5V9_PORTR|nr:hypothetical protein [Portunus trituberculatus]